MPFEFASSVNAVSKQQQIWGLIIGGAGLAILIYAVARDRGVVPTLAGLALICAGGVYFYHSWQLRHSGGEWQITIDQGLVRWQSPNQQVDPSFEIAMDKIDYIDYGTRSTASDERPRYHLILRDKSVIELRETSGINLSDFVHALRQQGIEIRETGQFNLPAELRNK